MTQIDMSTFQPATTDKANDSGIDMSTFQPAQVTTGTTAPPPTQTTTAQPSQGPPYSLAQQAQQMHEILGPVADPIIGTNRGVARTMAGGADLARKVIPAIGDTDFYKNLKEFADTPNEGLLQSLGEMYE